MILGGLDVGTTGCKIALYNEKAEYLTTYYKEYDIIRKNGQHEIDFNDVKNGVLSLLKQAVAEYQIDALGVTSFGETFAMLDEDDNILAPSMLYTDPRGEEECKLMCDTLGKEHLAMITGVEPHSLYSFPKILWWKHNKPELYQKCKHILLGEDFIVYTLTGNAQTDYSLAARTGMFDIENLCYYEEGFEKLGVDISLMSKAVPTGSIAGKVKEELKKELGISYDITIVNGGHDQIGGMIGARIFSTDSAMDGTGTVECIPVMLNEKPQNPGIYKCGYSIVPYLNGSYACYALSYTGGATLKWFRDNFAELENKQAEEQGKNVYAELDKAAPVGPTGILVLPHFSGAATPYMDNDSKAWLILIVAGIMEMVWAVAMDYSEGFTKIHFDILVIIFLTISMVLLSKALSMGLPVGTAYAVWTGIGAVGTITVSILLGNEVATIARILFIALIIGGIVGLQVTSGGNKEEN